MSAQSSPNNSPTNSPRPAVEAVEAVEAVNPQLSDLKRLSEWSGCEDFGKTEYEGCVGLNDQLLGMIHAQNAPRLKRLLEYEASQGKRDTAWSERLTQLKSDYNLVQHKALSKLLGVDIEDLKRSKSKKTVSIPQDLLGFLYDKLEGERQTVFTNLTPPTVKRGSGRKDKHRWVDKYSNKPTDAKREDWWFVGDADATMCKITSTDEKVSPPTRVKTYKSVSSNRYLGGEKSDPKDGKCCGAVIWDKASGSNALKKTGMSASAFRVRCGENSKGGLCSGCSSKSNAPNFFTDTYKISKGKGKAYDGMTYKDFICKKLVYRSNQ